MKYEIAECRDCDKLLYVITKELADEYRELFECLTKRHKEHKIKIYTIENGEIGSGLIWKH